jgi:8-oxo-dGTP pyrophosphatase MutT (NUDIX family)
MLQNKSCGAILFVRQNSQIKYLLLHYSGSYWGFVKGGVEPNETEKETVIRELKEETGITNAAFIEDFREPIEYFYRRKDAAVHKVAILYLMEAFSEKVQLSFEHKAYVWLDYNQTIKKLSYKNSKEVLRKAHDFLTTLASQENDRRNVVEFG